MRGTWRIRAAQRRAVQLAARAQRKVPWGVALTFDDGPSPEYTPAVLDALAELDVVATFFLLGDHARAHPEIVRRIAAEGHGIGSHSRSHPRFAQRDLAGITTEIADGRRDIEAVIQRPVRLFRPPHGHIDRRVALAMWRGRLDSWLWTVDTHDYVPGTSANEILERCATIRDRDVVLLHDAMADDDRAVDRSSTITALPRIVESVRARGLDLVAL